MKAGWQTKTLGEVLVKTETTNPLQSPDVEFEYIDVSSVSNQTFCIEETQKLKGKDAPSRARRLVKARDIIFATIRPTLQRIAIVPESLDQQVCSTGYFVLRPTNEVDHRFLYYSLFTERFMTQMASLQKGASYPAVTDGEVRAQLLSYPPLPEQHRIVAILDEAFSGIATARIHAEQNLQNARALFESHLQSVFSQRGEGWVEKPLCEVVTVLNGYAFKSGDFSSDGAIKSIKITNVGVREFVETGDSGLPADFAEKFASVAAPAGSLVIALTRTIIADGLKVAVVSPAYDRALVNQRVAALLPKPEEVSASYLFAYLSTSIVLNYVKERVNTLMQPNLSINDLRAMPIPLPPASERENIIHGLNTLEEETQRLEALYQRKLEALDELKQSLLHQAFSGQL